MHLPVRTFLASIVRAKSVAEVAGTIATHAAQSRTVVLARVWIRNATGSLELTASAGTPNGGGSYSRLDGEFREMAIADAVVEQIASRREPMIVGGIRGDEDWLTNPGWTARQGVRAFLGLPMIELEDAVGVVAIFDREIPTDDLLSQLQLTVEIAAARVAQLLATSVPPSDLRPLQEGRRSLAGTEVFTRAQLRNLEKQSIEAALKKTGGRVFGETGAAAVLGMRPTTLASRIKALGISRRH